MVKAAMIHHMNVAIADVETARDFYGRILGLQEIKRPNVGRPGLWFGCPPNELHLSVQPGVREGRTRMSLHPNERPERLGGHVAFTMSASATSPATSRPRESPTCAGRRGFRRSSASIRPGTSSS